MIPKRFITFIITLLLCIAAADAELAANWPDGPVDQGYTADQQGVGGWNYMFVNNQPCAAHCYAYKANWDEEFSVYRQNNMAFGHGGGSTDGLNNYWACLNWFSDLPNDTQVTISGFIRNTSSEPIELFIRRNRENLKFTLDLHAQQQITSRRRRQSGVFIYCQYKGQYGRPRLFCCSPQVVGRRCI
jgi:hypothetical protein